MIIRAQVGKKRKKNNVTTVFLVIFQSLFVMAYILFMGIMISNIVHPKLQKNYRILQEEPIVTNIETKGNTATTTTTTTTTTITTTTTTITTTTTSTESTTTTSTITTDTTDTTDFIESEEAIFEEIETPVWYGEVLNRNNGFIQGPSGTESYYNLPMQGVVSIMRGMGFDETNYPYWEREDGVKMLGPYVMCAANLELHPRGSVVQSSLGMALVCDTGGFIEWAPNNLDIAVNW